VTIDMEALAKAAEPHLTDEALYELSCEVTADAFYRAGARCGLDEATIKSLLTDLRAHPAARGVALIAMSALLGGAASMAQHYEHRKCFSDLITTNNLVLS
jgi:hypothetical protein